MPTNHAMAKGPGATAWQRPTTRTAILEAARDMIAREGLENTTLMRVASKSGFAPTTVFAYFVRKQELVAAIIADDLVGFARTFGDDFPFSHSTDRDVEAWDALAHDEVPDRRGITPLFGANRSTSESNAEERTSAPLRVVPVAAVEDERCPADGANAGGYAIGAAESLMNARRLSELEARVAEIEARHPSLEDHLHEFEIALSEIEARLTQHQAVQDNHATESRIDALDKRIDANEQSQLEDSEAYLAAIDRRFQSQEEKQRTDWNELKALLGEVLERLETLESARSADVDHHIATRDPELDTQLEILRQEFEDRPLALSDTSTHVDTPEHDRLAEDETAKGDTTTEARDDAEPQTPNDLHSDVPGIGQTDELLLDNEFPAPISETGAHEEIPEHSETNPGSAPAAAEADESYEQTARRAAMAAVSLVRSEEFRRSHDRSGSLASSSTTRYLLAACVGLALAVTVAGIFLRDRPAPGVASRAVRVIGAIPSPAKGAVAPTASIENIRAQTRKGLAYLTGDGVAKDPLQAGRLLSVAARAGEPVAQYWLAMLYEHGNGAPADPAESVRLFQASASQGNVRAMYKLAVSDAEGWGTSPNYAEAGRWFLQAAEFGDVNAQYNLGVLYERGLGVPQSLLDAYKWYALAAAQGDKDSQERIDVLSSQLTPDDLAIAHQAVSDFKPQPRDIGANWSPAPADSSGTPQTSPKT